MFQKICVFHSQNNNFNSKNNFTKILIKITPPEFRRKFKFAPLHSAKCAVCRRKFYSMQIISSFSRLRTFSLCFLIVEICLPYLNHADLRHIFYMRMIRKVASSKVCDEIFHEKAFSMKEWKEKTNVQENLRSVPKWFSQCSYGVYQNSSPLQ